MRRAFRHLLLLILICAIAHISPDVQQLSFAETTLKNSSNTLSIHKQKKKKKKKHKKKKACNNKKDDDGDGLVDMNDPGCGYSKDGSEVDPVEGTPDLGENASLNGARPFPDDNPWNTAIDTEPVDSNSDAIIASIGAGTGLHPDFGTVWEGAPIGIPYVVVPAEQPAVSVTFDYDDESDPGPYPVPADAPIEGGSNSDGDRHILVIDRDNWLLYELFYAFKTGPSSWQAGSGAIFDLSSNDVRPAGWTSADAAGLPIFPGLVRYDEVVERGEINHAIRFTCYPTRKAYVYPARHYASSNTSANLPPMGMRVRLKSDFNISGFSANVQVILRALKKYGLILADNGSDWYISGAPDPRWNDDELHELGDVQGSDFEVVQMNNIVTGN